MEGRMARPGAGAGDGRALLGGRQLAGSSVETKDEHAVEPLVRHDDRAASRTEHHVVRMRTSLLDAMRPGLAGKRDHLRRIRQRAIRANGQHRYVTRRVIGYHQKTAAGVNREMHTVSAASFGAIQRLQETGRPIHRKRRGIIFVAVHRIQVLVIRGDRQERRIHQIADMLYVRPLAVFGSP